jgi:hypothetical protein
MQEEWRNIKGFDGYKVSDLGRLQGKKGILTTRIEKNRGKDAYTRERVSMRGPDKKIKNKTVARLVAEAFIPNPDNLPIVDHRDTDSSNNKVTNLRWVSDTQNQQNKNASSTSTSAYKGVCFDKGKNKWKTQVNGKHVGYFTCQHEAATIYNFHAAALFGEHALLNQVKHETAPD